MAGLFYLGQLVIVVLGAMTLTAEYSTGMIRTSLTAMPRRTVVYAAKAVVFAVVALVVTFVAAFISFFLGQSLLASTHDTATLSQPNVLRAVVGSALYVTLCGLFAFAIGAIVRHTAGTITAVIGLLFVIPILVHLLPQSWYQDVTGGCRTPRAGPCRSRSDRRRRTCSPPGPSSPCSPSTRPSCSSWAPSCSASATPKRPGQRARRLRRRARLTAASGSRGRPR